jgi:galactose-1-phosphate uridylyltransferase
VAGVPTPAPEFRLDLLRGVWVLIASPPPASGSCPLCPSDEATGSPEHWWVRRPELLVGPGRIQGSWLGPTLLQGQAAGVAELLALCADHGGSWSSLDVRHSASIMATIAERLAGFAATDGMRAAIVTCRRHDLGSGLDHLHAWLAALPLVPEPVRQEATAFGRFAGNCLLCAVDQAEASFGRRVVHRSDSVSVICPSWSASPYEMLVLPRHRPHLHTTPTGDLAAVGWAVRSAVSALEQLVGHDRCRVVFHTAPFATDEFHWHAHVTVDGAPSVDLGVEVNPVGPERAAAELRPAYAAVA